MVKLVPIGDVRASEYNPRKNDEKRLALTEMSLRKLGFLLPIYADKDGEILSGHQRHLVAERMGFDKIPVQYVDQEDLNSRKALNVLFNRATNDLQKQDTCTKIKKRLYNMDIDSMCALGDGFFKGVFPNNNGRDFFKLEGDVLKAWTGRYGDKIVDFGAGKLNNTRTLRAAGVYVSAFEPYFVTTGDEIHKQKSLEIAERFLEEVESGVEYTSVFISSVFNSVPFMEDRKKIAAIAAALCYPKGQVVCWCQSNEAHQFTATKKKSVQDEARLTFDLDYEPNTILGDISKHPKVQKGHTSEEMTGIFAPKFRKIKRLDLIQKFWYLEAIEPILDVDALADALDFEFDLPYPDGSTMGLAGRAREVFEKRLGVKLPGKEGSYGK